MGHLFKAFKPLLSDFLSTIVLIVCLSLSGNLVLAVSAGMATGLAQVAIEKWRGREIQLMQWASLALVVVLGLASIASNNDLFVKLKPSIGGVAIACVMLVPNWQGRYLPQIVREHVSAFALTAWGYAWSALIFALAGINAWIALEMSREAWLEYSAFVPMTVQVLAFLVQYAWLRNAVRRSMRARMVMQAG